jgi:hypothetical protein
VSVGQYVLRCRGRQIHEARERQIRNTRTSRESACLFSDRPILRKNVRKFNKRKIKKGNQSWITCYTRKWDFVQLPEESKSNSKNFRFPEDLWLLFVRKQ